MTFLNPAILFGLLAASIPVIIHLLNLKKLKRIDFSAVFFLKELQKQKIRRIKLKQLLLLVLRVLIILSIVFAFARPAVKSIAIGGAASAAKTTAIIIIDNTFSMSALDGKGSYFNQSKDIALNLINQLQEGDEISIIPLAMSGEGNLETQNFASLQTTTNLQEARKKVSDIKTSSVSSTLDVSIIKAAEIFGKSNNYNKELFILSDFQTMRMSKNKAFSDLSEYLNNKVKIYSFNFGSKKPYNIAVSNLKINTKMFEKGKPVNVTATITNYSGKNVENGVVSLFLEEERCAQKSFSMKDGETIDVELEGIATSTGFNKVTAKLEDDDINDDNKRYAGVYIPEKNVVQVFYEKETDIKFLSAALNVASELSTLKIETYNANRINRSLMENADAVIFAGIENIAAAGILKEYLATGRGAFVMPGEGSTLNGFKALCNALGLPEPVNFINKSPVAGTGILAAKADFEHPLFEGIFGDKKKHSFDYPEVFSYFNLKPAGKGKSVISLDDNSLFLGDFNIENGKVLLLTSAPLLEKGNFALKSIFVPLIYKSVFYLSSKTPESRVYLAGDIIEVPFAKYSIGSVKVVSPLKVSEVINFSKVEGSKFVNLTNTSEAGIYELYNGSKLSEVIPVNTDPLESTTQYLSNAEFSKYLETLNFKGKLFPVAKDDNYTESIRSTRFGAELWRTFIILALILAVIESILSRNTKKELEGIE